MCERSESLRCEFIALLPSGETFLLFFFGIQKRNTQAVSFGAALIISISQIKVLSPIGISRYILFIVLPFVTLYFSLKVAFCETPYITVLAAVSTRSVTREEFFISLLSQVPLTFRQR